MKNWINVALPKGRLGEKAYKMLKNSGYECPAIEDPGRKLIFENPEKVSVISGSSPRMLPFT